MATTSRRRRPTRLPGATTAALLARLANRLHDPHARLSVTSVARTYGLDRLSAEALLDTLVLTHRALRTPTGQLVGLGTRRPAKAGLSRRRTDRVASQT